MYSNILIPVAFDEGGDVSEAVSVAKALSAKGAKITFLHVIEHIPAYAISYMPEDYLTQARKAIEAELTHIASEVGKATGVLVEGHSGRTILEWAGEHAVDCIVIASHRPGMQDFFLGSTAAQVVRHAKCAVHVLR